MWRISDFIKNRVEFFVRGATLGIDETNIRQHMRHTIMQGINKCIHNADATTKKGENELSIKNPKTDEAEQYRRQHMKQKRKIRKKQTSTKSLVKR